MSHRKHSLPDSLLGIQRHFVSLGYSVTPKVKSDFLCPAHTLCLNDPSHSTSTWTHASQPGGVCEFLAPASSWPYALPIAGWKNGCENQAKEQLSFIVDFCDCALPVFSPRKEAKCLELASGLLVWSTQFCVFLELQLLHLFTGPLFVRFY